jgi:hypothetical protein
MKIETFEYGRNQADDNTKYFEFVSLHGAFSYAGMSLIEE